MKDFALKVTAIVESYCSLFLSLWVSMTRLMCSKNNKRTTFNILI